MKILQWKVKILPLKNDDLCDRPGISRGWARSTVFAGGAFPDRWDFLSNDREHQSWYGSYITSCCIFSQLFGESLVGLDYIPSRHNSLTSPPKMRWSCRCAHNPPFLSCEIHQLSF